MKKIFLLVLLIIGKTGYTQGYLDFANSTWTYLSCVSDDFNPYATIKCETWISIIEGDTVIEGETYKKVYEHGFVNSFIREDDSQKVFIRSMLNTEERLLFNFGAG